MSLIIEHLEYLMRRHDCVALPGIGALMARNIPAHFDLDDNSRLLPPSRVIAFNSELAESDGLLERSVSKRSGISFEAARRIVGEECNSLLTQLYEFGQLPLGKLGLLTVTDGRKMTFQPFPTSGWDFRYYKLQPLDLAEWNRVPAPAPYSPNPEEEYPDVDSRRGITGRIIGIAASLALVLTLGLFLLNSPIKVDNEPAKASIAPETESAAVESVEPDASQLTPIESVDEAVQQVDLTGQTTRETETPAAEAATESTSGRYCVIVASFPDEAQANRFMAQNPNRSSGVLIKDGKYRVYSATASTMTEARMLRDKTGQTDAWICAR